MWQRFTVRGIGGVLCEVSWFPREDAEALYGNGLMLLVQNATGIPMQEQRLFADVRESETPNCFYIPCLNPEAASRFTALWRATGKLQINREIIGSTRVDVLGSSDDAAALTFVRRTPAQVASLHLVEQTPCRAAIHVIQDLFQRRLSPDCWMDPKLCQLAAGRVGSDTLEHVPAEAWNSRAFLRAVASGWDPSVSHDIDSHVWEGVFRSVAMEAWEDLSPELKILTTNLPLSVYRTIPENIWAIPEIYPCLKDSLEHSMGCRVDFRDEDLHNIAQHVPPILWNDRDFVQRVMHLIPEDCLAHVSPALWADQEFVEVIRTWISDSDFSLVPPEVYTNHVNADGATLREQFFEWLHPYDDWGDDSGEPRWA